MDPAMKEVAISDPSSLTVHPGAELFPMLDDAELAPLAKDIGANGLHSPIVVHDMQILDGRNRLKACAIAGVPPRFMEWGGTGSITEWILSANLHRRHLSTSQRALVAARAIDVFAKEADDRKRRGVADPDAARSRKRAADLLNVAASSVAVARQVLKRGAPDLVAAVTAGDVVVSAANEVVALPPEEQTTLVRENKVTERASEVRGQRRAARPRTVQEPPPPQPPSPPPTPPPAPSEEAGSEGDAAEKPDRPTAPVAQPLSQTIFRSEYRRGKTPKDEAPHIDQILAAANSALAAFRFLVVEWTEDHRFDMLFALDQSRDIAAHLNQAVERLAEVSAICNGRKPAPPPSQRR